MKVRALYWGASIICLISAIVCLCLFVQSYRSNTFEEFSPSTTAPVTDVTVTTNEVTTTTTPYVSPVDFEALQKENSDIYAWIQIPGTVVDYPVVQSSTDDSFYLDHGVDGEYTKKGSIFSEHLYNSISFTDPVTVLYGHNMASGEMFGDFQSLYWDREFLMDNDDIIIYLPDRELHFQIFAAMPFSRMHLLYYYRTDTKAGFDLLIEDIFSSRKLSSILIDERKPQFGDQVLVLSTCLSGDNRYRYLLIGVCKKQSSVVD